MTKLRKALWLESWGWKCKRKGEALIWTYAKHPHAVVQTEDRITYRDEGFESLKDAAKAAMKEHQDTVEREKER